MVRVMTILRLSATETPDTRGTRQRRLQAAMDRIEHLDSPHQQFRVVWEFLLQALDQRGDTGRLGRSIAVVLEVEIVDDFAEPRTALSLMPNLVCRTSKVHRAPSCPNPEEYMSKGTASGAAVASSANAKRAAAIDEAGDEPRGSDAVDAGPRSRDPDSVLKIDGIRWGPSGARAGGLHGRSDQLVRAPRTRSRRHPDREPRRNRSASAWPADRPAAEAPSRNRRPAINDLAVARLRRSCLSGLQLFQQRLVIARARLAELFDDVGVLDAYRCGFEDAGLPFTAAISCRSHSKSSSASDE